VSIVEISQELDQPGLKGLLAFLGPLLLDNVFNKIMPGVFHPNLLIYCRSEGVSFTEARQRKKRDLNMQLSFMAAQIVWGSSAATLYMSQRTMVPMLAFSEKVSAFWSVLPFHPSAPALHAITSMYTWAVTTTWSSL